MPFQSEKQRRYLWANEPEIARDWTDTYGSRIHKDEGGLAQFVETVLEREPAAFGGIMGADGRRGYWPGSSIIKKVVSAPKKIVKAVKKLAKTKLGKIGLMAAAAYFAPQMASYFSKGKAFAPGSFMGQLTGGNRLAALKTLLPGGVTPGGEQSNLLNFLSPTKGNVLRSAAQENIGSASKVKELMDAKALSLREKDFLQQVLKPEGIMDKIPGGAMTAIGLPSVAAGLYTAQQPIEELEGGDIYAGRDDEVDYWKSKFAAAPSEDDVWRIAATHRSAEGGRVPAQEGGLMNLGGLEKDYRNDGGFVPLGGEEKADDVPARLSKNEFVFTADAVRNAGGGDIDKGAEVMENVMKNLEAGGQVSEESQGEGAQEMFEVSERLSEVV